MRHGPWAELVDGERTGVAGRICEGCVDAIATSLSFSSDSLSYRLQETIFDASLVQIPGVRQRNSVERAGGCERRDQEAR